MCQLKLYVGLLSYWILFCMYNIYYFTKSTRQDSLEYFNRYLLHRKSVDHVNNEINTNGNLISTPGCIIPHFDMEFDKPDPNILRQSCGRRAVVVEKIDTYRIKFFIREKIMDIYTKGGRFACCYRYASRSSSPGQEDSDISYSVCVPFRNETEATLEQEFINVVCVRDDRKRVLYEDSYAIVKKTVSPLHHEKEPKWNVIIIGMDTMSRLRAAKTMPHTVQYLRSHRWLDFRGYNKIGRNTLPNLMAMLTGKKYSTVYERCSKNMTGCNDLLIWHRFQEAGYVTAYGEDYISLPDTFARLGGFRTPPTHHYLRPLYLTGETLKGCLLCTKTLPSAIHILLYALDFVRTYSNDSFFGFFWINSYSHDPSNFPSLVDFELVSFLETLNTLDAMKNTIVAFVSDHGIRFGPKREILEAYYEERLPMFFMRVPYEFQNTDPEAYLNSVNNQYVLTSPYDFYMTLRDILKRNGHVGRIPISEACPRSASLFSQMSRERNCADAGVDKKWCTCHSMREVDGLDTGATHSLDLIIKHLQNMTKTIRTASCMACHDLRLAKVSRIHFYVERNRVYYVVALFVSPEAIGYEAVVERDEDNYRLQTPIETITRYNNYAGCVSDSSDAMYCVCVRVKC